MIYYFEISHSTISLVYNNSGIILYIKYKIRENNEYSREMS